MRILVTGIPGESQYFSDFEKRERFLVRIVGELGHAVYSTAVPSRLELFWMYRKIVQDGVDAIILEMSMEQESTDRDIALFAGLMKGRDIPILFLRPDFFDDNTTHRRKGDNPARVILIKQFVEWLQDEGADVQFEYYCGTKTEPDEYNEQLNDRVKEIIRDFLTPNIAREREVVLSGREREV